MIEGYFPGAPDDGPTVAGLIGEAERRLSECRARCELLEAVAEAARELYERVEMDESVGICLSERVSSMRLGAALVAAGATGNAGT